MDSALTKATLESTGVTSPLFLADKGSEHPIPEAEVGMLVERDLLPLTWTSLWEGIAP